MSALLGGLARRILFDLRYRFITPERTTWEVKRYLPLLSRKTGVSEPDLLLAFEQMPIEAVGDGRYLQELSQVPRLGLRDPHDSDLVALARTRECPIWTHDRDLLDFPAVRTVTDRDLL